MSAPLSEAAQAFQSHRRDVRALLALLCAQLDDMAAGGASSKDWGDVGSIGYMRTQLIELAMTLSPSLAKDGESEERVRERIERALARGMGELETAVGLEGER